ncbi:MAG: DNA polymerase III subunit delta [Clostridia bacterium]|nr:DNA polymerase III subunit delta [Clostridia bacterium]
MRFIELNERLRQGVGIVYYVYGEDFYLKNSALDKIKSALSLQIPELNSNYYNGENDVFRDVIGSCRLSSIVDEKRLVVVKNFQLSRLESFGMFDQLKSYVTAPMMQCCLVIISEDNTIPALFKESEIIDCNKLSESEIIRWINAYCKHEKKAISKDAAAMICTYCSNDMTAVSMECSKLVNYADSGAITAEDVDLLVIKDVEVEVFGLSNCISKRDASGAMKALDLLLSRGEDPASLLLLLYNTLRRMFFVSTAKASEDEIAANLGVKKQAVRIAATNAALFTPIKLRRALKLCAEAEVEYKTNTVSVPERMRTLVLELVNI